MVTLWTKLVVLIFLGGFIVQTWSLKSNCGAVGFCGKGKHCIGDCCENCKDCKDGEYMDEDQNESTECKQCRKMPAGQFWVITRNCSSIQNAEYDCEDGYKKTKPPVAFDNQEECILDEITTTSTTPSTLPNNSTISGIVNTKRFGLITPAHSQDDDIPGWLIAVIVIVIVIVIGILAFIILRRCRTNNPPQTACPQRYSQVREDCNGNKNEDIGEDGGGARQDGKGDFSGKKDEDMEKDGGGARLDGRGDFIGKKDEDVEKDGGGARQDVRGDFIGKKDEDMEKDGGGARQDVRGDFNGKKDEDMEKDGAVLEIVNEKENGGDTPKASDVNKIEPKQTDKSYEFNVSKVLINNLFDCLFQSSEEPSIRSVFRELKVITALTSKCLRKKDLLEIWIKWFVNCVHPTKNVELVKNYVSKNNQFPVDTDKFEKCVTSLFEDIKDRRLSRNYRDLFKFMLDELDRTQFLNVFELGNIAIPDNDPAPYIQSVKYWEKCNPNEDILDVLVPIVKKNYPELFYRREFTANLRSVQRLPKESFSFVPGEIQHAKYAYKLFYYIFKNIRFENSEVFLLELKVNEHLKDSFNMEKILHKEETKHGKKDPVAYTRSARHWFYCHPGKDHLAEIKKSLKVCGEALHLQKEEFIDLCLVAEGKKKEGSDTGQGLVTLSASSDGEAQHETKSTDNVEEIQNEAESGTGIDPVGADGQNTDMDSEMKPLACKFNDNDEGWEDIDKNSSETDRFIN